jgi:hypothetical protein
MLPQRMGICKYVVDLTSLATEGKIELIDRPNGRAMRTAFEIYFDHFSSDT